jgi:CBS domain-containing protein
MSTTAGASIPEAGASVSEYETVLDGARKLAELGVEALPICSDDRRILGTLSRHDVVRIVAERRDPDAIRLGALLLTA